MLILRQCSPLTCTPASIAEGSCMRLRKEQSRKVTTYMLSPVRQLKCSLPIVALLCRRLQRQKHSSVRTSASGTSRDVAEATPSKQATGSKTEMLRFAVPALGISLAGPLMSNIDNVFVGKFDGTIGLAAMSPGTILSDYLLYLLIFLPRATVGLVTRARARGKEEARQELGRALSAAFYAGVGITLLLLLGTPAMLQLLGVSPSLHLAAGRYARIRGTVAWATLMQSVALSGLLACRDSLTPLKVVATAACLNFVGDWLFCAWPLQTGAAGAAAATAISTLAGFGLMLRALQKQNLLPQIRPMSWADLEPLLEYARPLAVIIFTRFLGLTVMALVAGKLGTVPQASYQILINLVVLCGLCGEPLSQAAQTMLPQFFDADPPRPAETRRALNNLLAIDITLGVVAASLSTMFLKLGSGVFTSDAAVEAMVSAAGTPMVPLCIASLILAQLIDGTQVAAKQFSFVIRMSLVTLVVQLIFLSFASRWNLGLPGIFLSLVLRYWIFAAATVTQVMTGSGNIGRAVTRYPKR